MMQSPRVARFKRDWSDAELDALIERRAIPVVLGKGTPRGDAEIFHKKAKAVFLSDSQIRRILRIFIDLARAHAETHFATDDDYLDHLYQRFPWGSDDTAAICFTGLAGIGKSQLLAALATILKYDSLVDVPGISGLPLVAVWLLTLRDGTGLNAILQPMLVPRNPQRAVDGDGEPAIARAKSVGLPELLRLVRTRTWRDAVCLLLIDEFQNHTKGDASARATAALRQLLTVGPRLVYCANFSLVNKLTRGKPDDRRRLISDHIEMLPDRKGSMAFRAYLEELKRIAPSILVFDVDEAHELIHDYTFGIKDYVVTLLKWAYVASRAPGNKGLVGVDEIRAAYLSAEYSTTRAEVLVLQTQTIQGKCLDANLWSPFRQPGSPFWAEDGESFEVASSVAAKVVDATRAIEERERRVADAFIASAMTREQADAERAADPRARAAQPRGKVVGLRRGRTTNQDLLDGADALDSL